MWRSCAASAWRRRPPTSSTSVDAPSRICTHRAWRKSSSLRLRHQLDEAAAHAGGTAPDGRPRRGGGCPGDGLRHRADLSEVRGRLHSPQPRRGLPCHQSRLGLPTWYGFVPDCGSVCEMLFRATGRRPYVIGKPRPDMAHLAMVHGGFPQRRRCCSATGSTPTLPAA